MKSPLRDRLGLVAEEQAQWHELRMEELAPRVYANSYKRIIRGYLRFVKRYLGQSVPRRKVESVLAGMILASDWEYLQHVRARLRTVPSRDLLLEKSELLAKALLELDREARGRRAGT